MSISDSRDLVLIGQKLGDLKKTPDFVHLNLKIEDSLVDLIIVPIYTKENGRKQWKQREEKKKWLPLLGFGSETLEEEDEYEMSILSSLIR